jgi:hypothetical protein
MLSRYAICLNEEALVEAKRVTVAMGLPALEEETQTQALLKKLRRLPILVLRGPVLDMIRNLETVKS